MDWACGIHQPLCDQLSAVKLGLPLLYRATCGALAMCVIEHPLCTYANQPPQRQALGWYVTPIVLVVMQHGYTTLLPTVGSIVEC